MIIETATKNDLVGIYQLYEMATAYQKTVSDKQWEGFEQTLIEKEIEENRLWKISNGNQMLCVFSINFSDKQFWGEKDKQPAIYIHRIALNTNFKGQSMMKIIIEWAKRYGEENAMQFIRMDTWGENEKLINYYKKCGFKHWNTIDLENTEGLPTHYKGKLALLEMKLNEPEILNSTKEDINEIFRLYKTATDFQKTRFTVHWPEFDRRLVATEIEENRQWKLVIEGEIACVWATTFSDPQIWEEKNIDPSVYIHRIATNPNFRGQNLVEKIVEWAKNYAPENNKKHIRLDTVGDNPGLISYYTKCGFDFLGLVKLKSTIGLPAHYHHAVVSLFEIKIN